MQDKINKPLDFFISPPFGKWIQTDWATSIEGSYTLESRPGLTKQILKTLRPTKKGWVNKIGLKNKGLRNIQSFEENRIYSIAAIENEDWREMLRLLPENIWLELNLSCPNLEDQPNFLEKFPFRLLPQFIEKFGWVSIKFPPTELTKQLLTKCIDYGLENAHLCNTLPTDRGGESGRKLKEKSMVLVQWAKENFPNLYVIAGGGIYSLEDLFDYQSHGADGFSLSTVYFTPWRIKKIRKYALS